MAASSAAACSGVMSSWYSVRSPDSTNGEESRAAGDNRSCRSSSTPATPCSASSLGRSRRIMAGPQVRPSSSSAVVTVGLASSLRRGPSRSSSLSTAVARLGDTDPSRTPAHTMPSGESGSTSAPSGRQCDAGGATARAIFATAAAPPWRSDGAWSRTQACGFVPSSATCPRFTASAVMVTRAADARAATSSITPMSSASSDPLAWCRTDWRSTKASRAASNRERRSSRFTGCRSMPPLYSNVRSITTPVDNLSEEGAGRGPH